MGYIMKIRKTRPDFSLNRFRNVNAELYDLMVNDYIKCGNISAISRKYKINYHSAKYYLSHIRHLIMQEETKRFTKIMKLLSKDKLGYIAGLIDGEGTISISKANRDNRIVNIPSVSIANTNLIAKKEIR